MLPLNSRSITLSLLRLYVIFRIDSRSLKMTVVECGKKCALPAKKNREKNHIFLLASFLLGSVVFLPTYVFHSLYIKDNLCNNSLMWPSFLFLLRLEFYPIFQEFLAVTKHSIKWKDSSLWLRILILIDQFEFNTNTYCQIRILHLEIMKKSHLVSLIQKKRFINLKLFWDKNGIRNRIVQAWKKFRSLSNLQEKFQGQKQGKIGNLLGPFNEPIKPFLRPKHAPHWIGLKWDFDCKFALEVAKHSCTCSI